MRRRLILVGVLVTVLLLAFAGSALADGPYGYMGYNAGYGYWQNCCYGQNYGSYQNYGYGNWQNCCYSYPQVRYQPYYNPCCYNPCPTTYSYHYKQPRVYSGYGMYAMYG